MKKILLMEEILHQLIGSLSHYLQGVMHPRSCRISSINSMIFLDYLVRCERKKFRTNLLPNDVE